MNALLSHGRRRSRLGFLLLVLCMGFAVSSTTPSHAQALGWEGETGLFVTPLAYTASSETQKFHPVVAYHYINGGPVIGSTRSRSSSGSVSDSNLVTRMNFILSGVI